MADIASIRETLSAIRGELAHVDVDLADIRMPPAEPPSQLTGDVFYAYTPPWEADPNQLAEPGTLARFVQERAIDWYNSIEANDFTPGIRSWLNFSAARAETVTIHNGRAAIRVLQDAAEQGATAISLPELAAALRRLDGLSKEGAEPFTAYGVTALYRRAQ